MSRLDDEEFAVKAPYIQQIMELEARVAQLEDALNGIGTYVCDQDRLRESVSYLEIDGRVDKALAATPAQSLQAIKDEVIEALARAVMDDQMGNA